MKPETKDRLIRCVKEVLPSTTKTCIWIIKITVAVSFAMMLLKYFQILPWISNAVSPVFKVFGLPGATALAYVSGYFVNVYSCIAVMTTLELDWRALTILCTMVMCSHSMVLETAVLKKTGANGVRMVIVRTLSAFILGIVLNLILPGEPDLAMETVERGPLAPWWPTLWEWFLSALKLVLMMTVEPGFGGQKLDARVIGKIRRLKDMGYRGEIEADGGIREDNLEMLAENGLTVAVMGTALFKNENMAACIKRLHRIGRGE